MSFFLFSIIYYKEGENVFFDLTYFGKRDILLVHLAEIDKKTQKK